jgi:hypothetical protein
LGGCRLEATKNMRITARDLGGVIIPIGAMALIITAVLVISGDLSYGPVLLGIGYCAALVVAIGTVGQIRCGFRTRLWLVLGVVAVLTCVTVAHLVANERRLYQVTVTNESGVVLDDIQFQFADGTSKSLRRLAPMQSRTLRVQTAAGCEPKRLWIEAGSGTPSYAERRVESCSGTALGYTEQVCVTVGLEVRSRRSEWYTRLGLESLVPRPPN